MRLRSKVSIVALVMIVVAVATSTFWLHLYRDLNSLHEFRVDVIDGDMPASAVVEGCRSAKPISQGQRRFQGQRTLTCEGDGVLRLRYADGRQLECPIGYFTMHMGARWRFAVRDGRCETVEVDYSW
jgi:hypothetical protein